MSVPLSTMMSWWWCKAVERLSPEQFERYYSNKGTKYMYML